MQKGIDDKPCLWGWWMGAIGVCLAVCVGGAFLSFALAECCLTVSDGCAPALFGDSFGAVNALISAFAFAGMIVTFVLQRYELRLQRHELKEQRDEFSKQNDTLRLQRFENTFFHMLELQQEIVADLSESVTTKVTAFDMDSVMLGNIPREVPITEEIKGRNLFYRAFVGVSQMPGSVNALPGMRDELKKNGLRGYCDQHVTTYFDHYFRHFYTILKFIDKNTWLGKESQYQYATFLRATLSRHELVWLYYNGLTFGQRKLKPLLEKYSMLSNLRVELLTLCKENRNQFRQKELTRDDIRGKGFSGTDFEFFLSLDGEDGKYKLSAFYSKSDMEKGEKMLQRWNKLMG